MEENQKYVELLKEKLESGKKSEYQLDEFLKEKSIIPKLREFIISGLEQDKSVKVTRGGWFWATKYFELKQPKGKRKSRRIENPESWVGVCPTPPPTQNLKLMMIDRIWLPEPREYNLKALETLREKLFSSFDSKGNPQWKDARIIINSSNAGNFVEEFRKCAAEFDYSQYLNQNYYKKIPTSGYKVTDILGK